MLSKKRHAEQTNDKQVPLTEVQAKRAPPILIQVTGSEENSEDQFPNKSSSEYTHENFESQSLTAQGYDKNTLGISKVKRRPSGGFREPE